MARRREWRQNPRTRLSTHALSTLKYCQRFPQKRQTWRRIVTRRSRPTRSGGTSSKGTRGGPCTSATPRSCVRTCTCSVRPCVLMDSCETLEQEEVIDERTCASCVCVCLCVVIVAQAAVTRAFCARRGTSRKISESCTTLARTICTFLRVSLVCELFFVYGGEDGTDVRLVLTWRCAADITKQLDRGTEEGRVEAMELCRAGQFREGSSKALGEEENLARRAGVCHSGS